MSSFVFRVLPYVFSGNTHGARNRFFNRLFASSTPPPSPVTSLTYPAWGRGGVGLVLDLALRQRLLQCGESIVGDLGVFEPKAL